MGTEKFCLFFRNKDAMISENYLQYFIEVVPMAGAGGDFPFYKIRFIPKSRKKSSFSQRRLHSTLYSKDLTIPFFILVSVVGIEMVVTRRLVNYRGNTEYYDGVRHVLPSPCDPFSLPLSHSFISSLSPSQPKPNSSHG